MLETIEKLLLLQDRDRRIHRVQQELAQIGPERDTYKPKPRPPRRSSKLPRPASNKSNPTANGWNSMLKTKKQQIEKYANQQLQTRKNEEYRALSHEIETCKAEIMKIEDQEIVLMEQAEAAQKEVVRDHAGGERKETGGRPNRQLNQREENLKKELAELQRGRAELAGAVEEAVCQRYERLFKSKGENVVVGVHHGVCGGCHMKLPAQILVMCQAHQELVTCTNCGRILYYTRDMALAGAE